MITKQDIIAALEAYWDDNGEGVYPMQHGAIQALLEMAELGEQARDRALTMTLRVSEADLIDHVAATIHAVVCDVDDKSCVSAERLDAAGRAVVDLIEAMRRAGRERGRRLTAGVDEPANRQVQYGRSVPPVERWEQIFGRTLRTPGLREQMLGRKLRMPVVKPFDPTVLVGAMEAFGQAAQAIAAAYQQFGRQIADLQADVDRVKVRTAFVDHAPAGRVKFDRDGAEWRKIDETRWASLAYLGWYPTLHDLESQLGPLSDGPPAPAVDDRS